MTLALVLVSCGGGSQGSTTVATTVVTTDPASVESTAPEPSSTVAADTTMPPHESPTITIDDEPCVPTTSPGISTVSVERVDGTRTYDVHMPDLGGSGLRVPLVIDMHGTTSTSAAQEAYTQLGAFGIESGRWVTATPQAIGPVPAWSVPGAVPGDDLNFIEEIVVDLVANACVDPARVYATGFSSGAAMSSYLGCASSLFAGVIPVAGVNLARRCEETPPVSLITFHGLADEIVPLEGLEGWDTSRFDDMRLFYRGEVWGTMESWARRNGCASEPVSSVVSDKTTRYEWPECVDGTVVVLFLTKDAGHIWPKTVDGVDATEEIRRAFLDAP